MKLYTSVRWNILMWETGIILYGCARIDHLTKSHQFQLFPITLMVFLPFYSWLRLYFADQTRPLSLTCYCNIWLFSDHQSPPIIITVPCTIKPAHFVDQTQTCDILEMWLTVFELECIIKLCLHLWSAGEIPCGQSVVRHWPTLTTASSPGVGYHQHIFWYCILWFSRRHCWVLYPSFGHLGAFFLVCLVSLVSAMVLSFCWTLLLVIIICPVLNVWSHMNFWLHVLPKCIFPFA